MRKKSKIVLIAEDLLKCQEMIDYMNSNADIKLVSSVNNIFIWSMKHEPLQDEESCVE